MGPVADADLVQIVLAPDSFKGSLSSPAVARALADGWQMVYPDADCRLMPLADGGEGTAEALVKATGGTMHRRLVGDPLGGEVEASFGILGSGARTAVVEVAAASGLPLITQDDRSAVNASSYGTGELIAAALDRGADRIILGLGGSATTDGGLGMAQALGIRFLDARGNDLGRGGSALQDLDRIDVSGAHRALANCAIVAACDVDHPLTGPGGAAHVFGPQKGAGAQSVQALDRGLTRLAQCATAAGLHGDADAPGSGAAGGIGFAVLSLLNGELQQGFEIVAEAIGLEAAIRDADLVITGEGQMDSQSVQGKAPGGVLRMAQSHGVPTIAVVGSIGEGVEEVLESGMAGIYPIAPGALNLDEAFAQAGKQLRRVSRSLAATWLAASAAQRQEGR